VAAALLLEHGCEKIPNDAMRRQFEAAGLPLDRFGWASVQLDGGIDRALGKVEAWFESAGRALPAAPRLPVGFGALSVGLLSAAMPGMAAAPALARVARAVLEGGGSVLIPEGDPLLAAADFRSRLLGNAPPRATLVYGQPVAEPGLHLVQTDSDHWVENLAGLGAGGVHVFLGLVGDSPQQGHPMLPVLQIAERSVLPAAAAVDVDLLLSGDLSRDEGDLLRLLASTAEGGFAPAANAGGFVDFQLSRGLLGVST
jgi:altronate dehydratase